MNQEKLLERIANLPPEKQKILEQRLLSKVSKKRSSSEKSPQKNLDTSLLSYSQERLWFFDKFEPQNPVYNIAMVFKIFGPLKVEALEASLHQLMIRHDSLRTSFYEDGDGNPRRKINDLTSPFFLTVVDLEDYKESKRENKAGERALLEAECPFILNAGPLIRLTLLRLGDEQHWLLATFHHIIADGWSVGIFQEELYQLYEAISRGEQFNFPQLHFTYSDFVIWQRHLFDEGTLDHQASYWEKQLAGVNSVLPLPTDRPPSLQQSYTGSVHFINLSKHLVQGIELLGQQQNATLYMTLLAAFHALLFRYTGERNICVGSAVSGRTRGKLEGLMGCFINTLVFRANFSENPTFSKLLHQIRENVLQGYDHQDLPFEKVVQKLNPGQRLHPTSLFQVMFEFDQAVCDSIEIPGLIISHEYSHTGSVLFDFSCFIRKRNQGLECAFEYNSGLFDSSTIERMGQHWHTLLQSIVKDPDQPVGSIPMLKEVEQEKLLVEWNQTTKAYSDQLYVHQLFEKQVARTPAAVAVVGSECQLTYDELNTRANQVAEILQAHGVGPEVTVGVCLERAPCLLVGLLGVLKTGGAYMPLDSANPKERLRFMVDDVNAALIMTQEKFRDEWLELGKTVLCLDDKKEALQSNKFPNPDIKIHSLNLAYVIYTSGSTGRPKGVQVQHQALVNHCYAIQERYGLQQDDKVYQFASVGFDVAAEEIWPTLSQGGTVVLSPAKASHSFEEFNAILTREHITVVNISASYWHGWLSMLARGNTMLPPTLRLVVVGSEPVLPQHLQDWHVVVKDQVHWCNAYGLSEATITSTVYDGDSRKNFVQCIQAVPIGTPISNVQVYVLDADLHLVPIGIPGELYIGGHGVARGYSNIPDLTAQNFLPNPFGKNRGARLYRTGDLARYLTDGNLEFLGRRDQQIKLRGFRIELGEIEASLARCPMVKEAVVLSRDDGNQKSVQLVAYVIPQGAAPEDETISKGTSATLLRKYLQDHLPDHMVPARILVLEGLPTLPNGKVDRVALGQIPLEPIVSDGQVARSLSPLEQIVTDIWCEVLGQEHIGIHDNFFELGGHSLLVARVMTRVREHFGVELPLRSLFESPTIAELADCIGPISNDSCREVSGKFSVPRISRDFPLQMSFSQEVAWLGYESDANKNGDTVPLCYRLKGPLNLNALERSLNVIVERHEALRAVFHVVDGKPLQSFLKIIDLKIQILDLSAFPHDQRIAETTRQALAEIQTPFDLACPPLIRAKVWCLNEEDHVFLLNIHGIVCDGWSVTVLEHELSLLYEGFCTGTQVSLPELWFQQADFAQAEREWFDEQKIAQYSNYWEDRFSGITEMSMDLPTDHPMPLKQTSFSGKEYGFVISDFLANRLRSLSRQEGVTLYMTLFAAFAVWLSRYTGQMDVIVNSGIANRLHTGTEGLIGFLMNDLVLRADLSGDPTVRALLQRVRVMALGAYEYQDTPLQILKKLTHTQMSEQQQPYLDVVFSYEPQRESLLGGLGKFQHLTIEEINVPTEWATYDLSFSMWENTGILQGAIEYNSDLFEPSTIDSMYRHWEVLVSGLITDVEQPISALPFFSKEEGYEVLHKTLQSDVWVVDKCCLHEWFQEQVSKTPEALAIICDHKSLTYNALNRKSNQLARYLVKKGISPDCPVWFNWDRSLETFVAMLGILKAGGAYVPVDSSLPCNRLRQMLQDVNPSLILSPHGLPEHFPVSGYSSLVLQNESQQINQECEDNLDVRMHPSNLAYIMYTSGSTGLPKGVSIPHRAVVALIQGNNFSHITCEDVMLQLAPLSFDASTFEVWGSLLNGARLVVSPERLPSLNNLGDLIQQNQVTILWLTAGLFQEFIAKKIDSLETVRQMLTGGDIVSPNAVQSLLRRFGECVVINGYGPTENTTFTTCHRITNVDQIGTRIPIGKPLGCTKVTILNGSFNQVPCRMAGALYGSGGGLARGYLNQPTSTAERFLPNPFSEMSGSRMYHTGDLARFRSDGGIEFLGRADRQVKIRGFRVELDEIESTIMKHPKVNNALVQLIEKPQNKQLIAYVVGKLNDAVTENELHEYIAQKLPSYMMVSSIMVIDSFPLTSNGKINVRALPISVESTKRPSLDPPQNDIEIKMTKLWEEVLNVRPVGRAENFFSLGGDSLLGVRLFFQIEKEWGYALPLPTLLEAPTITQLAGEVGKREKISSMNSLVAIQTKGVVPPLFLVHLVGGNVLTFGNLVSELGQTQPLYGLQSLGLNGTDLPYERIEDMAAHYIQEIQTLQPAGPYFLAGGCMGGLVAYEMAQQFRAKGENVAFLGIIETWLSDSVDHPAYAYPNLYRWSRNITHQLEIIKESGWKSWMDYVVNKIHKFKEKNDDTDLFGRDEAARKRDLVTRLNYQALQEYELEPYDGPVTYFLAAGRESVEEDDDPRLDWEDFCPCGFEVLRVQAPDAGAMFRQPHVQILAQQLDSALRLSRMKFNIDKPS